jgi:phosphohistidine phosphatase
MSLRIVLVRHAIAEPLAETHRDEDRRLTPEGIEKMELAARGLKCLKLEPDRILASPLRRAEETARILGDAFDLDAEVMDELAPGGRPQRVLAWLRKNQPAGTVLLVGHEPDLGEMTSWLLSGSAEAVAVHFKKGGAASVVLDAPASRPSGALEWLLSPRALRALAARKG